MAIVNIASNIVRVLPLGAQGATGSTTAPVFESRAAAMALTINVLMNVIHCLGYASAGDGGEQTLKRQVSSTSAAAVQDAGGAWWDIADEHLNFKMLGAKIDGSTVDTTAVQKTINAAITLQRPIVQGQGGVCICGPVSVTGSFGLSIGGWSRAAITFKPATNAQSYIFYFDETNERLRLHHMQFSDSGRSGANRCAVLLYSDANAFEYESLMFDTCITGLYLRRGAYGHGRFCYAVRCGTSFYQTGGFAGAQLAESDLYSFIADGAAGDPSGASGWTGIGFNILSNTAFCHWYSPTCAGTAYGIVISDPLGANAYMSSSRPDQQYFHDPNCDYVAQEAFRIDCAGLVEVNGGNFRSILGYAGKINNVVNCRLKASDFYESHLGGLEIGSNTTDFEEVWLIGCGIASNGYSTNTGGINLHLAGGTGLVKIEGGCVCNSTASIQRVNTTTHQADYNIVCESAFTGPLIIDGTDVSNARVTNLINVVGRANTTLTGLTTQKGCCIGRNFVYAATTNGSGVATIPHGLFIGGQTTPVGQTPTVYSATVNGIGYQTAVTNKDTTNIYVTVTNMSGTPQTAAAFTFHCFASVGAREV